MAEISESIAARLKKARLALGWTAEEAAKRIGYAASTIASVENGHDKPGKRLKALLTSAYNLAPAWLESGEGEMFASTASEGRERSQTLPPSGFDPSTDAQLSITTPDGTHRPARASDSVEDDDPTNDEEDDSKSDNLLYESKEFLRLDHLRTVSNLTWEQVSKEIGLSVGMIMMVKSGKRRMSRKAHHRLVEVEKRFGIEAYENLPMQELWKRPADTDTGTLADVLRIDELPRYIAGLEEHVRADRETLNLLQESLNESERALHLAKMAFAQKLRNQKNLSSDVARLNPQTIQQTLFDTFPEVQVMIEEARGEAAVSKQLAKEAQEAAEKLKAQNEALEDNLRRAEQALKQKLERQKNVPSDVAGDKPFIPIEHYVAPKGYPSVAEIIKSAEDAVDVAQAEAAAARAEAAEHKEAYEEANALLEQWENDDVHFQAQLAEVRRKYPAISERIKIVNSEEDSQTELHPRSDAA